jgi:hypothetical protein
MSITTCRVIHDGITYKIPLSKLQDLQVYLTSSIEFNKAIYDPSNPPDLKFEDLKDLIDKKFPATCLSGTNKTYFSQIKSLMKSLNLDCFSLGSLRDFSKVSDTIDSMTTSIGSKMNLFGVVSKMYQMYDLDVPRVYWDAIGKLKDLKVDSKFALSDKEKNIILRLDSEISLIEQRLKNNLLDGKGTPFQYQKLWLFYAYTEMPPIRRDYALMVFDVNKPSVNSINSKTFIISMKKYKNCKSASGGDYEIDMKNYSKTLAAFKDFIKHHPCYEQGKRIVISTKNKPVGISNFTKLLHVIFFPSVGVDVLRKFYINKLVQSDDVKEEIEVARIMRHTLATRNEHYIKDGLSIKKDKKDKKDKEIIKEVNESKEDSVQLI